MQATVRCSLCGPVVVWDTELMLHLSGDGAWYGFRCPSCANHVWCNANPPVVRLLCALGVTSRPPGVAEPITQEEICDFTLDLDRNWPYADLDDVA